MAARSSSGVVTKYQGKLQFWGFLSNRQCIVQHSICNPYKTAELIEMPFGMMARVGPRYHVLLFHIGRQAAPTLQRTIGFNTQYRTSDVGENLGRYYSRTERTAQRKDF